MIIILSGNQIVFKVMANTILTLKMYVFVCILLDFIYALKREI